MHPSTDGKAPEREAAAMGPAGDDRRGLVVEELGRWQPLAQELHRLLLERHHQEDLLSEMSVTIADQMISSVARVRALLEAPGGNGDGNTNVAANAFPCKGVPLLHHSPPPAGQMAGDVEGSTARSKYEKSWATDHPNYDYNTRQWRKYGQKNISGSKFKREYFKCAYYDEGCEATKYILQLNKNATPLYLVTRKNGHTCQPRNLPTEVDFSSNYGQQTMDFSSSSSKVNTNYLNPPKQQPPKTDDSGPSSYYVPKQESSVCYDEGVSDMVAGLSPLLKEDDFEEMLSDIDYGFAARDAE